MKKKINKFWMICIYLLFLVMWYYISFGATEFFSHGFYTCFEDLYGKWSIWFGVMIAVAAFGSPLYLRKWIKKELLISLTSIIISTIFVVIAFFAYWVTYDPFRDFTPERWQEYDRQRLIMLDDLRANHIKSGMTRGEVIEALGNPDKIGEDGTFEYSYNYGYISVFFHGEVVRSLGGIDQFGKHY